MALPTRTETLNTFVSSVAENRRKEFYDNIFGSSPFIIELRKGNKVMLKGGQNIRVSHGHTAYSASSFGRNSEFDTSITEFATSMVFDWKWSYSPCNLHGIDVALNDSPEQTFDLVDTAMQWAELSLVDDLGDQVFGDGSGNSGLDLDGLAIAVSRSGTYGSLARASSGVGSEIRAALEDTTSAVLSLSLANQDYQTCVVAREKPDLIPTTQTLWNRFWERSQPSERTTPGEEREIGYSAVRFNGARVVVDSHCPSGSIYYLNMKHWEWYIHPSYDFKFRGFNEPTNQMSMIGQLIVASALVCRAPRLQGVATART